MQNRPMCRYLVPEDVYRFREVSDPQLSPDGSRVAFLTAQPDRERDRDVAHVWVVPADGSAGAVQWTFGEEGEKSPRWSPDGSRLAFLAVRGEPAMPQVWILDGAGGEARRLTSLEHGVVDFVWSPDGARIACVAVTRPAADSAAEKAKPIVVRMLHHKADGQGLLGAARAHLFALDAGADAGGAPVQLTDGDFFVSAPAWSPDGGEIAFATAVHDGRDLDMASHLFAVPAGGGAPRQITSGPGTAGHPVWAGGDRIVFIGTEEARDLMVSLFAVPASGGEAAHLLDGFDRSVMPGGPGYPGAKPRLAPGGGSIVFCARVGGCVHVFELGLEHGATPQPRLGDDDIIVSGMTVAGPGTTIAAVVATSEHSGDVVVRDAEGGVRRLTEVNRELLSEVAVTRPERKTFTAPDGTEVEAFLYRPPGQEGPLPLLMGGERHPGLPRGDRRSGRRGGGRPRPAGGHRV